MNRVYLLTNSMQQSPSVIPNRSSASETFSPHFMEPGGLLSHLQQPTTVAIMSQKDPAHAPNQLLEYPF